MIFLFGKVLNGVMAHVIIKFFFQQLPSYLIEFRGDDPYPGDMNADTVWRPVHVKIKFSVSQRIMIEDDLNINIVVLNISLTVIFFVALLSPNFN